MVNARFGGHAIGQAALVTAPGLMVGAIILFMGSVSGASRIARQHRVLYVGAAATAPPSPFKAKKVHLEQLERPDPIGWALQELKGADLLIFAGIDAADEGLERIADLSDKKFLIAVAAHGAPVPARETRSSGLVVGRSLTEAGA